MNGDPVNRSAETSDEAAELLEHLAQFDWWESLTEKERESQIRWRMEHG